MCKRKYVSLLLDLLLFCLGREEEQHLLSYSKSRRRNHRHLGVPPVTPIACVRDTVCSQVFDQIWAEVRDIRVERLYCNIYVRMLKRMVVVVMGYTMVLCNKQHKVVCV